LPRADVKTLVYESQKLKVRVARVFEALERVVGARPGQKLDVNIRAASMEDTVRRASRPLALGFTAGFAMLASALTAGAERVPGWVPALFGLGATVFALGLLLDLLRKR
jgi:hypothetical protein